MMTRTLFGTVAGAIAADGVIISGESPAWIESALMWDDLRLLGARILLLFGVVMLAIVVDLIRGVQRAIRLGIARRSKGYRATINKVNEYFSFLTLFALIDVVILLSGVLHQLGVSGAPIFPVATACGCFYPIYVEIKSVREKMSASRQRDLQDSIKGLAQLMRSASSEDKGAVIDALNNAFFSDTDDDKIN